MEGEARDIEFDYSQLEVIQENQLQLQETLTTTNESLSLILSFLIVGAIVVLLVYAYKFFDMIFR